MSRISDALIAHYKLNDNLATTAVVDATGSHAGTFTSVGGNANTADHDAAGKINGALDFIGDDDYIEITDHPDFSPVLTPFSIAVNIFMDDATGFEIATKGALGTTGEWAFRINASDEPYAYFYDLSATAYIGRVGTALTNYQVGGSKAGWIHLVLTYDGDKNSSGIKLYLNGVQNDVSNYASGAFDGVENLAAPVYIGRSGTSYANGLIDNVMFWSIELTPDEVKRLYNDGYGTEIPADLDQTIRERRSGNSPNPMRQRYEK